MVHLAVWSAYSKRRMVPVPCSARFVEKSHLSYKQYAEKLDSAVAGTKVNACEWKALLDRPYYGREVLAKGAITLEDAQFLMGTIDLDAMRVYDEKAATAHEFARVTKVAALNAMAEIERQVADVHHGTLPAAQKKAKLQAL